MMADPQARAGPLAVVGSPAIREEIPAWRDEEAQLEDFPLVDLDLILHPDPPDPVVQELREVLEFWSPP